MDTANAMLLLSRLYYHSPPAFYGFLSSVFGDSGLGLEFSLQEHGEQTVPDAAIIQPGFKVVCETKLDAKSFTDKQIKGHCEGSFGKGSAHQFLLTLSPQALSPSEQDRVRSIVAGVNPCIGYAHLTFEGLHNGVRDEVDERDREFEGILDDYWDYCSTSGLIPGDWRNLLVRVAGRSFDYDIENGVYCDTPRGSGRHGYFGLYRDKSVQAIGKIEAVVDCRVINGAIKDPTVIQGEAGNGTPGGMLTAALRERIIKTHRDNALGDWVTRYHFVEHFYDTDYKKTSKRGLWGRRVFNLCSVLGVKTLPDIEGIAEGLRNRYWE
ncbi:MAG: hypothetical protein LBO07_02705 [Coriobacteriales bacterium]|nr:hypothetical protein [Coriobacteriales bacterium]